MLPACYTLETPEGISVNILDFGAIMQSLKAPGRKMVTQILSLVLTPSMITWKGISYA